MKNIFKRTKCEEEKEAVNLYNSFAAEIDREKINKCNYCISYIEGDYIIGRCVSLKKCEAHGGFLADKKKIVEDAKMYGITVQDLISLIELP